MSSNGGTGLKGSRGSSASSARGTGRGSDRGTSRGSDRGRSRGGLPVVRETKPRSPVTPSQSANEPEISTKKNYESILKNVMSLGKCVRDDFVPLKEANTAENVTATLKSLQEVVENLCEKIRTDETDGPKDNTSIAKGNTKTDLWNLVTEQSDGKRKMNSKLLKEKKENTDIVNMIKRFCSDEAIESPENCSTANNIQLILNMNKSMSSHLESLNRMVSERSNEKQGNPGKQDKKKKKDTDNIKKSTTSDKKHTEKPEENTVAMIVRTFEENESNIMSAIRDGQKLRDLERQFEQIIATIDGITNDKDRANENKDLTPQIIDGKLQKLRDMHEQTKSNLKYMVGKIEFMANNNGRQATPKRKTGNDSHTGGTQSPNIKQKTKNKDQNKMAGKSTDKTGVPNEMEDSGQTYFKDLLGSFEECLQFVEERLNKLSTDHSHCMNTVSKCVSMVQGIVDTQKEPTNSLDTEGLNSDVLEFNRDMEKLVKNVIDLNTKLRHYSEKIKDPDETNTTIEVLKRENEHLQLRLSKVAGVKLTEGNPSITNLSDSNRPTKLSDAFSELYDNEWTEVMDKFGGEKKKFDENVVLKHLCEIVMRSYDMCKEKSIKSVKDAANGIKTVTEAMMMTGCEEQMSIQAKEIRKSAVDNSAEEFYKFVRKTQKDVIKHFFKGLDPPVLTAIITTPFYDKCIKLCWKMVHQDPPMVLVRGPKEGESYDKTEFREYTRSGKTVVFTVWPALLLQHDGPILKKGVLSVK